MNSYEVRKQQFPTTRFREGYSQPEVDEFLGLVASALDGDASLTPADVVSKRFTPVRLKHGYAMEAVDAFLDRVEEELNRRERK